MGNGQLSLLSLLQILHSAGCVSVRLFVFMSCVLGPGPGHCYLCLFLLHVVFVFFVLCACATAYVCVTVGQWCGLDGIFVLTTMFLSQFSQNRNPNILA